MRGEEKGRQSRTPIETDDSSVVQPMVKPSKRREGTGQVVLNRYQSFVRWYMRSSLFRTLFHFIHLRYQHLLSGERLVAPVIPVVAGASSKRYGQTGDAVCFNDGETPALRGGVLGVVLRLIYSNNQRFLLREQPEASRLSATARTNTAGSSAACHGEAVPVPQGIIDSVRTLSINASPGECTPLLPGGTKLGQAASSSASDSTLEVQSAPQLQPNSEEAGTSSSAVPSGDAAPLEEAVAEAALLSRRQKHLWIGWIAGRAIPLGDSKAMRRAIRLDGFWDGLKGYANIWLPVTFYALLAHDIACYRLYPQDRYGNILWKIFAGLSPNQQTLTSYLNEFWWWPLTMLVGAPFLLGSYQALRRRNWHELREDIREKVRSYYSDNVLEEMCKYPWPCFATVFNRLDRITAQIMWSQRQPYLPLPHVELASEEDADPDEDYIDKIITLVEGTRGITQLYALSCLADIADVFNARSIEKLHTMGVSAEICWYLQDYHDRSLETLERYAHARLPAIRYALTLKSILSTSSELPTLLLAPRDKFPILVKRGDELYIYGVNSANILGYTRLDADKFSSLEFPRIGEEAWISKDTACQEVYDEIALKRGHRVTTDDILEGRRSSTSLNSLPRFFFVNHLLWKIGHRPRGRLAIALEPLFWSYNLTKDLILLYAKLRMFYAAGYFVYQNIDWLVNKQQCKKDHKTWVYVAAKASYDCTVCGNWRDIYYANMFAAQTCLDAVLAKPRTAVEVLSLIRQVAPFNFTRLDFSHQSWTGWDPEMWEQILSNVTVTANRTALVELNLAAEAAAGNTTAPVSIPDEHAQTLGDFLQHVAVQRLSLRGYELDANASALIFSNLEQFSEDTLLEIDLSHNPAAAEALPVLLELLPNSTQKLFLISNQLTDNDLVRIAPSFARFDSLFTLDLSGNQFSVSGLNAAAEYIGPQIQELDISGSDLAQANLTLFGGSLASSDLRRLVLRATGMTDQAFVSLAPFLPKMRSLQHFDVSENKLGRGGAYALIGVLNFTGISSINFSDNPLGDAGIVMLSGAIVGSNVTWFDIGNSGCGDIGMRRLCLNLPYTVMEGLNVSGNAIGAVGLEKLIPVFFDTHLQTLDFSGNRLGDKGAEVLSELLTIYGNRSLSLFLARNSITENGALMLGQAIAFEALAALDVSNNRIMDRGMFAFASAFNGSDISQFRASGCGLTGQSVDKLVEILPNTRLRTVDVSENAVGDVVTVKLAGALISTLPYKNALGNMHVSRDQLRALHNAHASTQVQMLWLESTNTTAVGARALCRVLHASGMSEPAMLGLEGNQIDPQQLDITTCVISAGASIQPFGANIFAFMQRSFVADGDLQSSRSSLQAGFAKQFTCFRASRFKDTCSRSGYIEERYELLRICLEALPSDVTKQMLHCALAMVLALRQEIGAEILRHLPTILRDVIYQQLQGPGGEILNISSELIVRAQTNGISAFVYDTTLVAKTACQKQRRDEEAHSQAVDSRWTQITSSIAVGLTALAGIYGIARAVTFASGSAILGCLVPSVILNAKKIVTEVTTAYQQSGALSAIDAGFDAIVFSFPGGALIERSLKQQSEALKLSRFGVFNGEPDRQNAKFVASASCSPDL